MPRHLLSPPLKSTFGRVYRAIALQPNKRSPELVTTGGVRFVAEAKETTDRRRFVSLPHSNRIYEEDWGFTANRMGREGQRIGQYAVPLDEWVRSLGTKETGLSTPVRYRPRENRHRNNLPAASASPDVYIGNWSATRNRLPYDRYSICLLRWRLNALVLIRRVTLPISIPYSAKNCFALST